MESISESYLRGVNYNDKDKTDDYRVFSIPITEDMAYRRLEGISKENNSHVRKVLDQYIWDAPEVLYGIGINDIKPNSIVFVLYKMLKIKCIDYKYQAYQYQAEYGEKLTILHDDVLYEYNEGQPFLKMCAINCDILKKQLRESKDNNGEKLTGIWEESDNRIKYTTKKLNNHE